MSLEYCLPISLKIESRYKLQCLITVIYVLPLAPIYLLLDVRDFVLTAILVAVLFCYEIFNLVNSNQSSSIFISRIGQWNLVHADGALDNINFLCAAKLGKKLLVLVSCNNRRKRILLSPKDQVYTHWHKMKVYLYNKP